jgi:hypothetical protein
MTERLENEITLINIIVACSMGAHMKTFIEEIDEFEGYCDHKLKEEFKKTREQVKTFLDMLSVNSSEKYRVFVVKLS